MSVSPIEPSHYNADETSRLQNIFTPETDPSRHSYQAASRPPTSTPGGSSNPKKTPNEGNVRMASARQGLFFEDEDSYVKYPEFKAYIEEMVFGNRSSVMRNESLQNIKTWRVENATKDEKTFFAGIMPRIIKEVRNVSVPKKRSFEGEIVHQAKSFKKDGLDQREDCLFVKSLLPLRTTSGEAASHGVTTAKSDVVYGLKIPRHPDLDEPILKGETMAEIEVAPGLQHAFFSVDNKGSQNSIEAAENQAMRAGATMVRARRLLDRKARGKIGPTMPENEARGTERVKVDAETATDAAMSDHFVTLAGAEAHTAATGPQAREAQEEEDLGVDTTSFAFTCSWVPQMANLHVHWCERRPGGFEVYHMNLLRGFLMSDNDHLSHFRKDVHNILDYGVSSKRKETLKQLESDIAKHEKESR